MLVIKRYPNRKLYDTEAKSYITLEQIAGLIRDGQEIQVIDNVTGEDLTAVVLTQIILEQEKKQAGFVPSTILAGLVQSGGRTLSSLRQSFINPHDLIHQIDTEIDQRIQSLISRGELAEEEARRWREKLLAQQPERFQPITLPSIKKRSLSYWLNTACRAKLIFTISPSNWKC